MMKTAEVLQKLESLGSTENIAGMARFGILAKKAFGVAAPELKNLAREIKQNSKDRHTFALELWKSGFHEARIIAYLTDDPKQLTNGQMDLWAADFDNWAITDGTCGHLFCRSPLAYSKVFEWSERDEEFIKRAGLVLAAWLAVHDKKAPDEMIAEFLPLLERHADDDRNFVKKAVSWSLRQIGKRSQGLNKLAVEAAECIKKQNIRSAAWIASDALRELKSEKVKERLEARAIKRSPGGN